MKNYFWPFACFAGMLCIANAAPPLEDNDTSSYRPPSATPTAPMMEDFCQDDQVVPVLPEDLELFTAYLPMSYFEAHDGDSIRRALGAIPREQDREVIAKSVGSIISGAPPRLLGPSALSTIHRLSRLKDIPLQARHVTWLILGLSYPVPEKDDPHFPPDECLKLLLQVPPVHWEGALNLVQKLAQWAGAPSPLSLTKRNLNLLSTIISLDPTTWRWTVELTCAYGTPTMSGPQLAKILGALPLLEKPAYAKCYLDRNFAKLGLMNHPLENDEKVSLICGLATLHAACCLPDDIVSFLCEKFPPQATPLVTLGEIFMLFTKFINPAGCQAFYDFASACFTPPMTAEDKKAVMANIITQVRGGNFNIIGTLRPNPQFNNISFHNFMDWAWLAMYPPALNQNLELAPSYSD